MKKTIVILTIVLAILAAPVFAEVTASGEVDFEWAFNADDYAEKINDNEVSVDLGGTVGDYTSVAAVIKAEYDDEDGDLIGGIDTGDRTVYMKSLTITQDVTGALEMDSPVSVALTVGVDNYEVKEYNDMAYGDFDKDSELDPGTILTVVSLGVDAFTVDAFMAEDNKYGVNAYGNVADMADVSAYYIADFTLTAHDFASAAPADADKPYTYGVNAGIMAMDGLKVGLGYEAAAWDTDTAGALETKSAYGLSLVYTGVDALTLTLGTNTEMYEDSDFAEDTSYRVAADYAVNDMFSVNAAMGANISNVDGAGDDVDFADAVVYEVGAKAMVDSVCYMAGYTMESDNNAYAAGFTDGTDRAANFYLKMKASF